MNSAEVILRQILIMFVYLALGYLLFRFKLITKEGSKALVHVLLYIALPCVIIKSFFVRNMAQLRQEVLFSLFLGLLILLLSMAVSALLFRKQPMENFAASFSNAGFMGLPLISAAVGDQAIVYTAGMIALLNVLQWTYGQRLLSGKTAEKQWKKLFNPLTVSFAVGLFLFYANITLPEIAVSCISSLAALNGVLAMLILGVYLAQTQMLQMFGRIRSYLVCAVRLLLIPLLTFGLLCLVPGQPVMMKQALLVAACTPIGANVAVYAQKLDRDYTYAVQLVCLSTLLSILSMPLIMGLASLVWGSSAS